MKIKHLFLLFTVTVLTVAEEHYIDYENQDSWEGECQFNNKSQSPINFGTYFYSDENSYSFINYNRPLSECNITNNGESIETTCKGFTIFPAKIKSSQGSFKFYKFHFHWGPDNSVGSEHTWNSQSLPLELHIVHYNEKYQTFSKAVKESDGILVLGVLFQLRDSATPAIGKLGNMVSSLDKSGSSSRIPFKFSLNDLVPQLRGPKLDSFFNYQGSLTTPPCTEATWLVNKYAGRVSNEVLNNLRNILNPKGEKIIKNYRDIQPTRTEVLNVQ